MGCGCKKKKNSGQLVNKSSQSSVETDTRQTMIKEQKDYQDKVKSALRSLMEIKKRKQGGGPIK